MNKHGGKREGSGRKPKSEEQALIDKPSPYDDLAIEKMIQGVKNGDYRFVKMFIENRWGKPKESKEITLNEDLPLFID